MEKRHLSPRIAILCMVIFLVATLLTLFTSSAGWAKEYKLPKILYWGCRHIGSAIASSAITTSEAVGPELGIKIRMIPGEDIEMINMLNAGRVQLATFAADNYWATMGLAHYATFAMGPQPLRMIWSGIPFTAPVGGIATKTSGIKTPYDLKGKRVVQVIGAAWSTEGIASHLAFANLTLNDVKCFDVSSATAAYKSLTEGKADYTAGSVAAPDIYELEASPNGCTVVRFPFDNKEGWERLQKVVPYFVRGYTTEGAGVKKGEKIEVPIFPWPATTTLASQSDELVYAICKAIYNKIDTIVAAYKTNRALLPERGIVPEAVIMAPYHPGAIKFFKEKGIWTDAHEKANNKRLEHLKKVNARWEQFVQESEEKMIKTKIKVDPLKEWPKIVEGEIGLVP